VAHSLSSKKRIRQNAKRRQINHSRMGKVKAEIKRFQESLAGGDLESAQKAYRRAVKRLDKTAAKSTMHKKTAARRKSQLAKQLNSLSARQN